MKKVLIGLGIGCGALILIGVIALGAGAFWLKKTAGGALTNMTEASNQIAAQENKFKELDRKYSFKAPPAGEPLKLDEDRLKDYLAVRREALPVYKEFESKAKDLNAKYKDSKSAGISGAMEATSLMGNLMTSMREAYIKGLDEHHMSPREFGTITGTIYATGMAAGLVGQRDAMKKQLAQLDEQIASAPAEQRSSLENERNALKQAMASLPDSKNDTAVAANAELLAKYKDQIEKDANPAFDAFISQSAEGFGRAMGGYGFHNMNKGAQAAEPSDEGSDNAKDDGAKDSDGDGDDK